MYLARANIDCSDFTANLCRTFEFLFTIVSIYPHETHENRSRSRRAKITHRLFRNAENLDIYRHARAIEISLIDDNKHAK